MKPARTRTPNARTDTGLNVCTRHGCNTIPPPARANPAPAWCSSASTLQSVRAKKLGAPATTSLARCSQPRLALPARQRPAPAVPARPGHRRQPQERASSCNAFDRGGVSAVHSRCHLFRAANHTSTQPREHRTVRESTLTSFPTMFFLGWTSEGVKVILFLLSFVREEGVVRSAEMLSASLPAFAPGVAAFAPR